MFIAIYIIIYQWWLGIVRYVEIQVDYYRAVCLHLVINVESKAGFGEARIILAHVGH
jgi:hypothetical protein